MSWTFHLPSTIRRNRDIELIVKDITLDKVSLTHDSNTIVIDIFNDHVQLSTMMITR